MMSFSPTRVTTISPNSYYYIPKGGKKSLETIERKKRRERGGESGRRECEMV